MGRLPLAVFSPGRGRLYALAPPPSAKHLTNHVTNCLTGPVLLRTAKAGGRVRKGGQQAMSEEIRVHVIEEKDRTNLVMRYRDPVTGKHVKKSAGTDNRKEAKKRVAQWEANVNEGRYHAPLKTTWEEFRQRYEAEHLATLAPGTQDRAGRALDHYERHMSPRLLRDVNASRISLFHSKMRTETREDGIPCNRSDATIAAHLRHLKAAFRWGESVGIMTKAPKVTMPKRVKGAKLMKGRPLVGEELDRLISAAKKVRRRDADAWEFYLRGLWLSGLRLQESLALSWDADADFAVDLSGKHPRFRIAGSAQKSGQDQLLPMTPDFAQHILAVPEGDRHGSVFRLVTETGRINWRWVGVIVSRIGAKAGIVTDSAKGRHATAHDLRRSFGSRWAKKVMPATLQLLMRHSSINTTMGYYVSIAADDVAADLWAKHGEADGKGPVLGPSRQIQPQMGSLEK